MYEIEFLESSGATVFAADVVSIGELLAAHETDLCSADRAVVLCHCVILLENDVL